jgi:hypothetical protein
MSRATSDRAADIVLLELQSTLSPLREIEEAIERYSTRDPHLRVYRSKVQEVRSYIQSALVATAAGMSERKRVRQNIDHDDSVTTQWQDLELGA